MEQTPKTILLIDDNVDLLETLAFALESAGFRVVTRLTNGVSLRQELKAPIDLIVVDSSPSGEDERILTAELKVLLQTQHIPLLLISNQSNISSPARKTGATAFLAKPFNPNSFLTAVEQCLEAPSDLK